MEIKERPKSLKNALKNRLSQIEIKNLTRSFDIIGDIAVIEIPKLLEKKEKLIAQTLIDSHKNINVVCRKIGGHKGQLRIQKYKFLAGENRKETEYRENNCRFRLNIEKTYFSPRLSNERKRIFQQVKPDESILVMFSGIAPYPITISKNSKAKHITAIELNKQAHKYAEQNVKLNKISNITLYQGDVKKIVPKLKKDRKSIKFDRILMPLPKGAEDFLVTALKASKKGTIIHFYDFEREDEFQKAKEKVKLACKKLKRNCRILRIVKCGQNAPRFFRICVDFKVY
ncbi:MAG: class I SAM-dependent methyltransferase family protein [Candidatus Woesearchaeota archaeon]